MSWLITRFLLINSAINSSGPFNITFEITIRDDITIASNQVYVHFSTDGSYPDNITDGTLMATISNFSMTIEDGGEYVEEDNNPGEGGGTSSGTITDENGNVIRFEDEYDAHGNRIRRSLYDKNGNLTRVYEFNTNGNVIRCEYYENGKLIGTYENEYDTNGNQIRSKLSAYENGKLLGVAEDEYDTNGTRIKSSSYDENGKLTSITEFDKNGNQRKYSEYDVSGRLTRVYEHDEAGNLIKDSYYDESGHLIRERVYEYDGNGNLIRVSER